jgi:tetratricopeptide (TPR) repeat protein
MQPNAQLSNHASTLSALAILFFLILITYGNTFDAAWHLDDYQNITNNPNLHKISNPTFSNLWDSLHSPVKKRISRPVAMLSFALNWYIGSNHVLGYHLVNLLIHLLTAFFLYLTMVNLLKTPNLENRYRESAGFIALLAAVLWAIHPIQTQAVTYIVQRMASLAAMFYILGIYCFIKARLETLKKYKTILFLCCSLSFLLGIGSKENAATLPIALILIEVIFFRDLSDRRTRNICITGLIGGGIIIFVAGVFMFKNGDFGSLLKASSFRTFSPIERLITEPRVIVFYLSQIFYPVISRYSIEHDIVVSTSLFAPMTTLPAILLVFGLIAVGLSQMRKRPILSFAILFFFLNHMIESSILSLELIFEHRNYLPSFFLFLPVAVGVKWLLDYYQKRNRRLVLILVSFITILLTLLGTATYIRNRTWATEYSLWEDASEKAPGSNRPPHNLAWAYYERIGEYDTALQLYESALKLKMNNRAQKSVTLNNMASIYFQRGNYHKAAKLWQASVVAYPKYVLMKYRLARALEESGQTQKALELIDKILTDRPHYMDPLILKGTILLKQSQFEEALFIFKKCLQRNPYEKRVLLNIGIAYNLMAQYERAELYFKIRHSRYPSDRSSLVWLIDTGLKSDDTLMANNYTDKLLGLIRIEELNTIMVKLVEENLMDSQSRDLVKGKIIDRLADRVEDLNGQLLGQQS